MKMNKEQFLKTEFGGELESTITAWDDALSRNREDKEVLRTLAWCQAQWEVYQMAIKHFYGVEYHFTRTDEYYGLCTEDESDWLMRVKRVKLFQMETVFSRQRVTRRGIRIDGVEYSGFVGNGANGKSGRGAESACGTDWTGGFQEPREGF